MDAIFSGVQHSWEKSMGNSHDHSGNRKDDGLVILQAWEREETQKKRLELGQGMSNRCLLGLSKPHSGSSCVLPPKQQCHFSSRSGPKPGTSGFPSFSSIPKFIRQWILVAVVKLTSESDIFFYLLCFSPSSKLPSFPDCKTENPNWSS